MFSTGADFHQFPLSFDKFNQILLNNFPQDMDRKQTRGESLYALMNQFIARSGYQDSIAGKGKFNTGLYYKAHSPAQGNQNGRRDSAAA